MAPVWTPGVTLLLGEPGSGKTTTLRRLIARDRRRAIVVWDPNAEHSECSVDLEARVPEFLRAQAASAKRIRRVRTWGGQADFDALCSFLVAVGGPATLALDELHCVAPTTGHRTHPFRELVLRHRHLRFRLLAVGWRPAELPRYLTAANPLVLLGRTRQRLDLEFIAAQWGAELAEQAPKLLPGDLIQWPRS